MEEKNITVDKIMRLRDASITGWTEAINRAKLVQGFIRHDPYTQKQKDEAKEFNKPLLRYNVLVAKLLGLEGQELVNRRKTIFEPRYNSSADLVRIISDHYEFLCNREAQTTKLIKAMVDGLCYPTGGWLRRTTPLDDHGYLTVKWNNCDTFLVHPDPTFREMDLSDADFVVLDEWMTKDAINSLFKPKPFSGYEAKQMYNEIITRKGEPYYGTTNTIDGDRHLVCQIEERVHADLDVCWVDGEIMTLTTDEADHLSDQGREVDYIKSTQGTKIKCTTVLPSHHMVLEAKEYKFDSKRFSFFPCFSYDWTMEKRRQPSLMYILTDIQDAISKAKSQHLDFMIQQLVEDYHVSASEERAIADIEETKGKPHRVIRYRNINNIAKQMTGSRNAGALQAIQSDIYMSLDFMSEVSNITPAMEGKAGKSGESGSLFNAKVERGLTTTNPYYEIKAKVNLTIAKDFLEIAKDVFFEDDRVMEKRYDPKNELNFEVVNLQLNNITYNDVRKAVMEAVLDEGENTEAKREQTFQENLAFAQMLINANVPSETIPWENIVENSNLRDKHLWVKALAEAKGLMEMYATDQLAANRMAQTAEAMPEQRQGAE